MSFLPLENLLKGRLSRNSPMKKQIDAAQTVEAAEKVFIEVFGAELANHVKPLFLKNRTLTVSCSTSVMAQEIRLRQAEIVEKINQKLEISMIDRLRYLT